MCSNPGVEGGAYYYKLPSGGVGLNDLVVTWRPTKRIDQFFYMVYLLMKTSRMKFNIDYH